MLCMASSLKTKSTTKMFHRQTESTTKEFYSQIKKRLCERWQKWSYSWRTFEIPLELVTESQNNVSFLVNTSFIDKRRKSCNSNPLFRNGIQGDKVSEEKDTKGEQLPVHKKRSLKFAKKLPWSDRIKERYLTKLKSNELVLQCNPFHSRYTTHDIQSIKPTYIHPNSNNSE